MDKKGGNSIFPGSTKIEDDVPVPEPTLVYVSKDVKKEPRHTRYSIDYDVNLDLHDIELNDPNVDKKRSMSMSHPMSKKRSIVSTVSMIKKDEYGFIPAHVRIWVLLFVIIVISILVFVFFILWTKTSPVYKNLGVR